MAPDEITRKTESYILRRLAAARQHRVAEQCEMAESTVSRFAAGEAGIKLPDLGRFLDALGLRLVDEDMCYVPQAEYAALRTLARRALSEEGEGHGSHPG